MRDRLAIYNERVKSLSNFLTAIGIGLVGFAVIRPAIESASAEWPNAAWGAAGLAMHAVAHYVLGYLKKDD